MRLSIFITFAIAQFLDGFTTYLCLKDKGNAEGNPVVKWVMDKLGIVPALAITKGLYTAFAGVVLYMYPMLYVQIGVAAIALLYMVIVWNNYRHLRL